jgi:NAD(P)-dependent dehydrogenase (short-subunit alcohol dehydrogenase family)
MKTKPNSNIEKVAIVTGAGSGIGRASAVLLAESGFRVVVSDIQLDTAQETAGLIQKLGGTSIAIKTDVTSEDECRALVDLAVSKFGRLDAAFNNAGIAGYPVLTGDLSLENWQRVIDVNLTGVFNCLKYELNAMKQLGSGGAIVNTASIMGLRGVAGGAAYCASKHAVIGLTKAAALEYGRDNIRVNALCPGYISTPMTKGIDSVFPEKHMQAAISRGAMKRLGEPDEIAEMVLWLCSDSSSFVTGASHVIDAGVTANT